MARPQAGSSEDLLSGSGVTFLMPALLEGTSQHSGTGRTLWNRIRQSPECLTSVSSYVQQAAQCASSIIPDLAKRLKGRGGRGPLDAKQDPVMQDLYSFEAALSDGCMLFFRALDPHQQAAVVGAKEQVTGSRPKKEAGADAGATPGSSSGTCVDVILGAVVAALTAVAHWGYQRTNALVGTSAVAPGSNALQAALELSKALKALHLTPRELLEASAFVAVALEAVAAALQSVAAQKPAAAASAQQQQQKQQAQAREVQSKLARCEAEAAALMALAVRAGAACELLQSAPESLGDDSRAPGGQPMDEGGSASLASSRQAAPFVNASISPAGAMIQDEGLFGQSGEYVRHWLQWSGYDDDAHDTFDRLASALSRLVESRHSVSLVLRQSLLQDALVGEVARGGAAGGIEAVNLQLLLTALRAVNRSS